jgi:hypothetical protein
MGKWIEVVTDPLGLAGFALFLVFGAAASYGFRRGQTWLPKAAVAMAVVALVGGLALSWQTRDSRAAREAEAKSHIPSSQPPPTSTSVQQTTHGSGSPTVQGVTGNVTITSDKAAK